MADMWRITANPKVYHQSPSDITANLERVDTDGFSVLGAGMTESSGIFTFPSTGYYLINAFANGDNTASTSQYIEFEIMVTLDNSSYSVASQSYSSIGAANFFYGVSTTHIIDVTDTVNIKVKFRAASQHASSAIFGETNRSQNGFQFIRLGDT
jgi:hypothetical protein